jgi:hypothetical protein
MDKITIPNIVLPAAGPKPLYYSTFVLYMRELLDYLGIAYALSGEIALGVSKFEMTLGSDTRLLFDFSDHPNDFLSNWSEFDAYFKFHYVEDIHGDCSGIFPFAPVSFYDWGQYYSLKEQIHYSCNTNVILNMQRPGGAATERRKFVQKMLFGQYKSLAVTNTVSQVEYWKKINDCLVHVFVPGARNDMLDRGHMQYLAFGCCTIAPKIIDVLPYYGKLVPGIHYVECRSDYLDLIDKIEWVRSNRTRAIEIGKNAKILFERSCEPDKLWNWILLHGNF